MEASREFCRTPPHLPPCSDVSVLQKTRMSHFWDTHHRLMRAPLVAHVPWWPAQGRLGQQEFQIGSKNFGPQHARSTRGTPSTPPVEWYIFATMETQVTAAMRLFQRCD